MTEMVAPIAELRQRIRKPCCSLPPVLLAMRAAGC